MDLAKLSEPLKIDQVEFRIQSINLGGYAAILAYKDARVDMERLDAVAGALNWKREHARDNHNCIVSIWNPEINQWIGKEDTGTESNAEAQKGLASDSFKRACFNWGIGRELYDYPQIQVKLNNNEYEIKSYCNNQKRWVADDLPSKKKAFATWELKLKEWLWYSEFTDGKISFLAARDKKTVRFQWGKRK